MSFSSKTVPRTATAYTSSHPPPTVACHTPADMPSLVESDMRRLLPRLPKLPSASATSAAGVKSPAAVAAARAASREARRTFVFLSAPRAGRPKQTARPASGRRLLNGATG